MEEEQDLPLLNERQKRFCEEYLIDLNGTRAAKAAGYSEKTANRIASQNLSKLDIQNYIQLRQKDLQKQTGITQERVLNEFAKIAFIDIRKYYDGNGKLLKPHELSDEAAAALSGIDVEEIKIEGITIGETKKIRLQNKLAALESLGKHLGIFEKDNEQNKPTALLKMEVLIKSTGIPLASNEKEIRE